MDGEANVASEKRADDVAKMTSQKKRRRFSIAASL